MKRLRKKITATAISLAAVGLSSCTTLIDTGGYLDAVGKQVPSHQLVEKKVSWGNNSGAGSFFCLQAGFNLLC